MALVLLVGLSAADPQFTAANGNWNVAGNWDTGIIPVNGDVTIPVGKICTVPAGYTTGAMGTVTVQGTLTVTGTGVYGILNAVTIANSGTVNLTNGRINNCTFTGTAPNCTAGMLDAAVLDCSPTIGGAASAVISIMSGLTIKNGRTLTLGQAGGTYYGYLSIADGVSAITTDGTANIVYGNHASNGINDAGNAATLTISSGLTITGGKGYIKCDGTASTLTCDATVVCNAAASAITIGVAGTRPLTVTGPLQVSNGTLTLDGVWTKTGAGSLQVSGGILALDGTVPLTAFDPTLWARTGGAVYLAGTCTVTGNTLDISDATGDVTMNAGTIVGGTITQTGSSVLKFTATTNVLNGVTADCNLGAYCATGNLTINILNNLVIANGRTIQLGSGATYYTYMQMLGGTQSITTPGTATITFGSHASNLIWDGNTANTTMTIGSGITVNGVTGSVAAYAAGSTMTIDADITCAGGGIIGVGYSSATTRTHTVNGTLSVSSGTMNVYGTTTINCNPTISGGTMTFRNAWAMAGIFQLSSGIVNLGGTFNESSIDPVRWNRSGGTVNLTGTCTNTGSTLDLTAATGDIIMNAGTIVGGTITQAGGALLKFTVTTNTLNGVTLDCDLGLYCATGNLIVSILNNLVIANGRTMQVGSGATYYTFVQMLGGTQSISTTGTATITFGGHTSNIIYDGATANTALTLESGLSINGISGRLAITGTNSTLTINSTVSCTGGGTIAIGDNGYPTRAHTLNNSLSISSGTMNIYGITAINGNATVTNGTMNLFHTWTMTGIFQLSSGIVNLGGTFNESSIDPARWNRSGGTVNLTGTCTNTGSTLDLTAATGDIIMNAGTIVGGTITQAGGALLKFTATTNVFNGVTVDCDLGAYCATGDVTINVLNNLVIANGRTIQQGSGASYRTIVQMLGGTQSISTPGTATITFGSNVGNLIYDGNTANTIMSISGGITINGVSGMIFAYAAGSTMTINAAVNCAGGGTFNIGHSINTTPTHTINGPLSLSSGTMNVYGTTTINCNPTISGGTMTMQNAWTMTGIFQLSSGIVNLGGTFNESSINPARWNRSGGTVNLTGTCTNTGSTLDLTAATGDIIMNAGTIVGGTITQAGGALLKFTATTNTFNGVTLDCDLEAYVATANMDSLMITNSLVLANGRTLYLGQGATYRTYMRFTGGTQSISSPGAATITFGAKTDNIIYDNSVAASALTIASSITVNGHSGQIYASGVGSTMTINGPVTCAQGGTMLIGNSGGTRVHTINGTVLVSSGTLNLYAVWTNNGTISGAGAVTLAGTGTNQGTMTVRGSAATGSWSINGTSFTNGASGLIDLEATSAAANDKLTHTAGTVNLGGTVRLRAIQGYVPGAGDTLTLISMAAGSPVGTFTTYQGPGALSYGAAGTAVRAVLTAQTRPSVTLTSAATSPTETSPVPFTITFDQAVTDLTTGDFTLGGASIQNLAGAGTTYTAELTPTGPGTVSVALAQDCAFSAAWVGNTASNTLTRVYNRRPVITQGANIGVTMSEDGAPTAFTVTIGGTDADGDTLTWSLSSDASNGTATVGGTGASPTVTYAPTANWNGTDSFVVEVSDGVWPAVTTTVTVTVQAVNDAPGTVSLSSPINCPDAGAAGIAGDDLATYGRTLSRRPTLIWTVPADTDGDRLHFRVGLDQVDGSTEVVNSGTSQAAFRFDPGTGWEAFPAIGVLPSSGRVRYVPTTDLDQDSAAFWKVRAHDGTVFGAWASVRRFVVVTPSWTDSDLTGKNIKALHMSELRTEVNYCRLFRGLLAKSAANGNNWTDSVLVAGQTHVKAVHMTELRQALEDVATVTGSTATIGAEAINPGVFVRSAHLVELRTALGEP